jgi:hypothetical protein
MNFRTMTAAMAVAIGSVASINTAAAASCEENFVVEGSFLKGKQFKTWAEHTGSNYDAAFRKVAQEVAAGGFGAVNSSKDTGIISAGQAVTMGNGAVAPLTAIVSEKEGGVIRVDANFSIAGMQATSAETVKTGLCKIANAPM